MSAAAPRVLLSAIHRQAATTARLPLRSFAPPPISARSVSRRSYASERPRHNETYGSKNPFPILPLLAILVAGSSGFYFLVQSRKEPMPAVEDPKSKPQIPAPAQTVPAFSKDEASVIFVLGGPGAGKGTQCQNLVREYGFVHLSAGDLLRAEQNREGSQYGELIKTYIREGKIVPMEVTIALLKNAMDDAIKTQNKNKFLIDGFPRQMDQALKFEETVCESRFTLFFDCTEEVMLKRLLKRGETSGREDDNIESIKKRFRTFVETSRPVVDHYRTQGKVVDVRAMDTPENVYSQVKRELKDKLEGAVSTP